eukprot:1874204-Pyramimonas_sp.AAC.1
MFINNSTGLGGGQVRATCNVRARLAHELDSEKEVLDLLEQGRPSHSEVAVSCEQPTKMDVSDRATAAASAPTASSGQRVSLTAAQVKTHALDK